MQKPMIIVSGLPRSGTSMMMKMLEAGGLEVLIDNIREADEDNPKGYYEFEKVKSLDEDDTWLHEAGGKVVKMVSRLLKDLPTDRHYNVIFMRRNMDEIIRSQNKMLERLGKDKLHQDDGVIATLFEKHLAEMETWLNKAGHLDYIYVSYNEMLSQPESNVKKVNDFLGGCLNVERMLSTVDTSLYRQQTKK